MRWQCRWRDFEYPARAGSHGARARDRFRDGNVPRETVTECEVAILRLLAGGDSNKEIARSLFLAEGTVKNDVSAILEKLGTRDRTRAVLKAITLQVI